MWNWKRNAINAHGKTLELYGKELVRMAESNEFYQKDMAVCITALERILSDLRKVTYEETETEN